jgi:hypothetical protein
MYEISLDGGNDQKPYIPAKILAEPVAKPKLVSLKGPIDPTLIPLIVKHMPPSDMYKLLRLSWLWFKHASNLLYQSVTFSQLAGKRVSLFLQTLQSSVLTSKGVRKTVLDYASLVKKLYISHIVFDEPSELQSWNDIRDVISLCSKSLTTISLVIGDDSFSDLPTNHTYLHPHTQLTSLRHLEVASKCPNLPEQLIVELLRASPVNKLHAIRLPKLMSNFSSTGWYLIAERGGAALVDLELTPSIGFNMLGWDETCFHNGMEQIIKSCRKLKFLDLSGHAMGITPVILGSLMSKLQVETIFLPSGLDDSHLITILTGPTWNSLKTLGFMPISEEKPLSFFKLSDQMMKAVIEHLLSFPNERIKLILPQYLLSVKSGKPVSVFDFIRGLDCKELEAGVWLYKEKIVISAPVKKLMRARELLE